MFEGKRIKEMLHLDLRPVVQDILSLVVSIRAPRLELSLSDFVNSMNTIYQGVLNGIFRQMPIAAWFRAQCKRLDVGMCMGTVWMDLIDQATCDGHFWLMEPKTGDFFDSAKATFIAALNCS